MIDPFLLPAAPRSAPASASDTGSVPAPGALPASDFASAAMLRVLARGMRLAGLDPERSGPEPPVRRGRVALDAKRALVASAVRQGGIGVLPLLGRGVHLCAHEPAHRCLGAARDAADLLARWRRLERYIHSRHRVEVVLLRPGRVELAHRSLDPTRPPLAAEDLVVLGVLCALLEAIGAREVRARIGAGGPVDAWSADHGRLAYPCPDAAGLALAAAGGSTARWRIDWTGTPGTPGASSKGTHEADLLASVACLRDPSWPPIVERTAALLAADLARPPALPALAAAVGCSPRSLQRALAAEGTTRAGLLADLRARAAAWWLLRTAVAPAEIGFVCGYADQPHFTRQFRDRVGVTPAKYREAFGSA